MRKENRSSSILTANYLSLFLPFSSFPCSFIVSPLSHSYSSNLFHLPRLAVLCGLFGFLSPADVYFLPCRVVSTEIVILIPTVFYLSCHIVRRSKAAVPCTSTYVCVRVCVACGSIVRVSHRLILR